MAIGSGFAKDWDEHVKFAKEVVSAWPEWEQTMLGGKPIEPPNGVSRPKVYHEVCIRPWGKYETTYVGSGFVVKVITVNPGQRLSLQRHRYRDEHWFIVEGTAETSVGQNTEDLLVFTDYSGESIDIPKGRWHRIKNKEQTPLIFIEVQTGNCFEEDIERLEDDYGRVGI